VLGYFPGFLPRPAKRLGNCRQERRAICCSGGITGNSSAIPVMEELPTTHPESSHPLQRAVQAIITRTHGPHLWNEIRAVWGFNRCWVRAVWGEVYRPRDTRRLDRTVAVKILPAHLSDNPETQAAL
jgi:hypothetical protein